MHRQTGRQSIIRWLRNSRVLESGNSRGRKRASDRLGADLQCHIACQFWHREAQHLHVLGLCHDLPELWVKVHHIFYLHGIDCKYNTHYNPCPSVHITINHQNFIPIKLRYCYCNLNSYSCITVPEVTSFNTKPIILFKMLVVISNTNIPASLLFNQTKQTIWKMELTIKTYSDPKALKQYDSLVMQIYWQSTEHQSCLSLD